MRGMDFLDWLRAMGGVCATNAALEHVSKRTLRGLRDSGQLWVPLRGWVALVDVRNEVTRALELGGIVTCVSALRMHGLWVPHGDTDLHVRPNRETHSDRVSRTAGKSGIRLHRQHRRLADERPWDGVDGALAALVTATGCVSSTDATVAASSALASGLVQQDDLTDVALELPRRRRLLLEHATGQSGSGTESIFAEMLRRARIAFVQQPELLPGEYFDFLVGKSLVIEIDSLEWHGSRAQMAKDRSRDARLTALGYRMLRFTYEQVMFDPDGVMRTVLDLVRRNVHQRVLLRPRP